MGPADSAVGWTAVGVELAAGVEEDSRCWACLLLSFEMKVTGCSFLGDARGESRNYNQEAEETEARWVHPSCPKHLLDKTLRLL